LFVENFYLFSCPLRGSLRIKMVLRYFQWANQNGLGPSVSAQNALDANFADCEKYDLSTANLRPIQA
jgi:hypothetical protein